MVETRKLAQQEAELLTIMRWEDDGGKIMETDYVILDPPFVQSVPIQGALPDLSLPWNQQFVSEPSRAGVGKAPGRK